MANAPFRMTAVHLIIPGTGDTTACGMLKRLTSHTSDVRQVTCGECRSSVRRSRTKEGAAHG